MCPQSVPPAVMQEWGRTPPRSAEIVEVPAVYYSYVLRLWNSHSEEGATWRASLQDVQTDERVSFASIEELIDYLWTLAADAGEDRCC